MLTEKFGILDIRAKLDNSVDVDIEMQVVNYGDIQKRMLYYWSKIYSSNLNSGETYISNQKARTSINKKILIGENSIRIF